MFTTKQCFTTVYWIASNIHAWLPTKCRHTCFNTSQSLNHRFIVSYRLLNLPCIFFLVLRFIILIGYFILWEASPIYPLSALTLSLGPISKNSDVTILSSWEATINPNNITSDYVQCYFVPKRWLLVIVGEELSSIFKVLKLRSINRHQKIVPYVTFQPIVE